MINAIDMTGERFNANEAIDNFILGGEARLWSHKYIANEAVPYCDIANRCICSPVMPAIADPVADKFVRAKNEHEAGHARFTPSDKDPSWSALKGRLMNVLEDLRIEKGLAKLSAVFESDIRSMNKTLIERHQGMFRAGGVRMKAVNEALMALHFNANGFPPEWQLSEKGRTYYDVALPIFGEWKEVDCTSKEGFFALEKIADRIIEAWNEACNGQGNQNEQQQEDGNGNQGNNQQKGNQGGNQGDNQGDDSQDGDNQGDNQGDADEEATAGNDGGGQGPRIEC